MQDKVDIKLNSPIESSRGTLDTVTVRACTFADIEMTGIRKAEELDDLKNFKKLASHLTSLSPEDIGKIDMRDWMKIGGAVSHFLGLSPQL